MVDYILHNLERGKHFSYYHPQPLHERLLRHVAEDYHPHLPDAGLVDRRDSPYREESASRIQRRPDLRAKFCGFLKTRGDPYLSLNGEVVGQSVKFFWCGATYAVGRPVDHPSLQWRRSIQL